MSTQGVKKLVKRGRVVWRAKVKVDGRRMQASFATEREAKAELPKLRAQLERLQDAGESLSDWGGKVPTLSEFAERFLEHQQTINRPSEMRLKRQILRDHVLPAFGHLRLDQLTVALADGYKAGKLKTLRPNTVANHVTLIKRVLSVARDWGILSDPPRIKQVRAGQGEVDFLDRAEAQRFLDPAGDWRPFMLLGMRSGLRLGELRGLQWGDIDLDRRRLRVARTRTKDGCGEPKSGKGRTVDLPADACDVLASIKPAKAGRTALVFPSPSGGPLDERAVYKACVRASKRAELGRVINPHKLRHTFASHHAMAGTPLPVLQAWMGHADIKTTMIYAHLCPSTAATFADRISSTPGLRVVAGTTNGATNDDEMRRVAF